MTAEVYPPRDAPWEDRGQPFTYGEAGTTDGSPMPSVPEPEASEPDEPDSDSDDIGYDPPGDRSVKKATSCDVGDLVRVKMLDGTLYTGRLVYLDDDWVDVATSDEPGNRKRMLAPIDEVELVELLSI